MEDELYKSMSREIANYRDALKHIRNELSEYSAFKVYLITDYQKSMEKISEILEMVGL